MNLACKENLTLTGIIGLTLLSGLALTLPTASADTDIVDDVSIEVPAACALTSTLDTNHTAEVNNGVYEPNIGKTTLKVTCNDSGGFSIYAIGFTGDTYTGEDHTKLIGADTGSKISTKVYASSDTTSNWSMKLTPVSGSTISIENSFDNYHVVPDTFTKVATINSGTTPTTGASVETTYSAYMSGTQPADTYTGKVKYTMVHPSTNDTNSFVVNFFANGGAGTMSSQKISRGVATALSANSFTAPDGLRFAGWNTKLDGSGTTYANSASVTNLADAGESVNLYAIWQEVLYMQDLTSTTIASLLPNEHSTATVIDKRDNQEYTIAKLKDGKYWMVENLNLAGGTALSADDTDVTSAYISSFSTSNKLTKTGDTIVLPASSTSGINTENNYSYVYNSGNKTNCGASGQDTPCYSYYSWDAATLGSGRSISTDNTDAPYSICPKGWRLPTTGADSNNGWKRGDFYALATAYGANLESDYYENSATFYNNAGPGTVPNFLLAGYYTLYWWFFSGAGYFWSSTSSSDTSNARRLHFNSSRIYSANYSSRYSGFSVRCLYGS